MKEKSFFNINLQIIFGITLMAVMGVASLTPAFPKMIEALKIKPGEIGLLVSVFTLPGIILSPIVGILADRIGRKKILVVSLFLFGVAGSTCFYVTDFNILLLLRFIQGIGAASLGSLNVTVIGDIYSGNERTKIMGYNAGVLSVGTALYPAIGGAMAVLGWNYPFLLTLTALPIGFLTLLFLNNPEPKNEQKLSEYLKNALMAFKNKETIILFAGSVITFIILYGAYLIYLPLLLADKFHASSVMIGVMLSCMSVVTAIISSNLGRLAKLFSEKILLKSSFLFCAVALLIFPFLGNMWFLFFPIIIFGIGHGLSFPNIQSLLAGIAPIKYRAIFMSLNGMVQRLGQTLGPLLAGLVFFSFGMSTVFIASAGLAVITSIILYIYLK